MRRKSILLALGIVLSLLVVSGLVLGLLVKHEPHDYHRLGLAPGAERQHQSSAFQSQFFNLMNGIKNRDREWEGKFTADQINSYFQEDFVHSVGGDANLPEDCHDPRLSIEPDKLRLAFRYGSGFWSTIVTVELRIWLVANEVNMIGVEILSLRAGTLPVSPQILLDRITESVRNASMEVTWYRDRGNPVAILRYQPHLTYPTLVLQRLELQQGRLVISGRSPEATGVRSSMKQSN